jgi:tripartite-type tricarboxylate transporter receptor subunit TctC
MFFKWRPKRKSSRTVLPRTLRACLLIALSAPALQAAASPADYPAKPVTIVVPAPPGGIIDASARLMGIQLSRVLGQPFVVENKSGGSGNVAYAQVARSAAEGYTLLASYSGYHVGNPLLTPKLPWAQKDLEPVALIAAATNVITVHPSVPAHTLAELIAYLKAHPGELSYASQGNGSVSHIGTEIFKQQTGTQILHVPYRGSGPALQDVLANQVQVFITTPPSVIGHIKSGKLRALAVTAKQRYPELPDVPTTAEAGLKGYELETWVALFAPAGTPRTVIDKLSTQVRQAMEKPETRASAEAAGFEARYEAPDVVSRRVASESARWAQAIKEGGIKPD